MPMTTLFTAVVFVMCALALAWGAHVLPKRRWQILAAMPLSLNPDGSWKGLNITYYGMLTATACAVGATLLLILYSSVGISCVQTAALMLILFAVSLPASRLLARLIEKKTAVASVGGGAFVGLLVAVPAMLLLNCFVPAAKAIAVMPALAALACVYAISEGLGRLACVSFGCCYGKPLSMAPYWIRVVFRRLHVVFNEPTRKAVYEGKLLGVPLVPIQMISASILVLSGILGLWLFLRGWFTSAFLMSLAASQVWRVLSEFLRFDERGKLNRLGLTAYQTLSLGAIAWAFGIAFVYRGGSAPAIDLHAGLTQLWNPAVILALQALWAVVFFASGRSQVTGSVLSFHVNRPKPAGGVSA